MGKPSDLIQGTLDLLILKTVALEPKHGWAIGKRIQQISSDVLQITQGSLYPAPCIASSSRDGSRRRPGRTATGRGREVLCADRGRSQAAREGARKMGPGLSVGS